MKNNLPWRAKNKKPLEAQGIHCFNTAQFTTFFDYAG